MQADLVLNTNGTSLWSNAAPAAVKIFNIECLVPETDEGTLDTFGELRVFFDTSTWLVKEDGLIYTDEAFAKELNAFLATKGLPTVHYSEQGMQGDEYVSFDVDEGFINAWCANVEQL